MYIYIYVYGALCEEAWQERARVGGPISDLRSLISDLRSLISDLRSPISDL